MKDLLIVGTYIKDDSVENIIYEAISRLYSHFDVALVAHTPASERIQKLVKYFIYDSRNEIMYKDIATVYWGNHPTFYYEIHPDGKRGYHSFAMYRSLTNAVKLLSHEYDSFTYIEGDSWFSLEDIPILKGLKDVAKNNQKQALFVSYGEWFVGNFFYCEMEFLKEAFGFFKNSDEFLERCRIVGSYGDLENYLYKSIEHGKKLNDVHIIDGNSIPPMFPNSQLELNRHNGKEGGKLAPYVFEVMRIENTEEFGYFYQVPANKYYSNFQLKVDGEFIKELPSSGFLGVDRIYPKNENFIITIGDNEFSYNKTEILKNKSFIRFK